MSRAASSGRGAAAVALAMVLWIVFVVVCILGYIENIVKLAEYGGPSMSSIEILRITGIPVPPLGTVMGLFVGN